MDAIVEPRQAMPIEAYTSDDWFSRERQELFEKVWTFAGMTEDLKLAGDYKCVQVGRYPIVVLRDRTNELRAFHNLCRHRGSQLLKGSGNVGEAITCFYHRWKYDLNGQLLRVPQEKKQFPGLDKSCLGLRPAKLATWRNIVFVHPDPEAESLRTWLADFPETVGPHEPENLVEAAHIRYRVKANWKIIVENFIDGYHFFYLHPNSLGDGDFFAQKWRPAGRHWTFYRPLKAGVSHDNEALPVLEGVDPTYGAGAYVLFPNLALYERATYWLTFFVEPLAANRSIVELRIRTMPEVLEKLRNESDEAPTTGDLPDYIESAKGPAAFIRLPSDDVHPLESDNVMLEDIYACEAVQNGMGSPKCEIGPLSKWESALIFYQRQILDYVPANF